MNGLDYAAIRQRVPIRCVLLLLAYEPTHRRGHQWRGPCPLPDCSPSAAPSRDRSFSVHVKRHLFRCFRCGRSGNQFDLWAHATGLSLYPATLDLCQRLSVVPIYLKNPQPRNQL
jgi:DNA primase